MGVNIKFCKVYATVYLKACLLVARIEQNSNQQLSFRTLQDSNNSNVTVNFVSRNSPKNHLFIDGSSGLMMCHLELRSYRILSKLLRKKKPPSSSHRRQQHQSASVAVSALISLSCSIIAAEPAYSPYLSIEFKHTLTSSLSLIPFLAHDFMNTPD
ncbi:hypothetical protein L2E82_49110 [Cichorium intybus]|uniref:Uncharacterized protein n=1 Tax=Cichorium intybus TaxID=13427 RepID=A0ACB8YZW2_CICIN|nr:hypothetical protein L2E82_49110 [Cichorium intybus]